MITPSQIRPMLVDFFTQNLSYKFVSLFISLILWLTIMGRRDFVYTKTIDLEFHTSPGFSVVARPEQVRLRVSGNRAALRHFMESTADQNIVIDLSNRPVGLLEFETPLSQIEVPLGVKILSVRPGTIRAEILPDLKKPPVVPPGKEIQ